MTHGPNATVVLSALREGFAAAAARVRPDPISIDLAGARIAVRIAGPELAAALLRPFAHLRVAEGGAGPESAIEVWSEAETGVGRPEGVPRGPRSLTASLDGRSVVHAEGPSATALDRSTGDVVGHRAGVDALAAHERAKPFPELLAVHLLDRGALKVHGGLVAVEGAGALLAGPSGAGKSTASLACATAGLDWLGDDQVALVDDDDTTTVGLSIYATARLTPALLDRHPELACGAEPVPVVGEKSLLFLAEGSTVRFRRSVPVRAVVVPSGEGRPGLEPLPRAAALLAVAPSSVLGVVGGGAAGFQRLGDLVARSECFVARHGGDPRRVPDLVAEALRRSGGA